MNTALFLKLFASLFAAMVAIDLVWLGVVMKGFYAEKLGYILAPTVNWVPGVIFYAIFISGLIYFVVTPGIASGSLLRTALMGAFFGLVAYATYDLSNHATLRDWPLAVTLADMVWGSLLSGVLASLGFLLARWFA